MLKKAFFKRRIDIPPGLPWIPADQLDFTVAGMIVLSLWVPLTWPDAFWIAVVSFTGDILINHAAFYLGVRNTRW